MEMEKNKMATKWKKKEKVLQVVIFSLSCIFLLLSSAQARRVKEVSLIDSPGRIQLSIEAKVHQPQIRVVIDTNVVFSAFRVGYGIASVNGCILESAGTDFTWVVTPRILREYQRLFDKQILKGHIIPIVDVFTGRYIHPLRTIVEIAEKVGDKEPVIEFS
ncbi:MAG: hypothetical protein DRP73_04265, partial [Candidatus Omnitrophota bacterium]